MLNAATLAQALSEIDVLLQRQREAALEGRADELAPIGDALNARLGAILSHVGRPHAIGQRQRVDALREAASFNYQLLNRRRLEVQRGLDVLSAHAAPLQHVQSPGMYGAAGGMSNSVPRGRSLASA
jgi:hypothetical protein